MPQEKKSNEPIKVTDKRIFTSDGDLKDEYRGQVNPIDPAKAREAAQQPPAADSSAAAPQQQPAREAEPVTDRRFLILLQVLADQVIQTLDYARRGVPDASEGARQFIDLIEALSDKTSGNLSLEEADTLKRLLAELKLRFVQVTKGVKV